jgi:hypothetical protein
VFFSGQPDGQCHCVPVLFLSFPLCMLLNR